MAGMLINPTEGAVLDSSGGIYRIIHLPYPFFCSLFQDSMQARGSERVCQTTHFWGFLMRLHMPGGIQQSASRTCA